MNIWEWTFAANTELRKNGNTRLADIMENLPNYVCNDNHDKVDLIYPEALSLAKKQDNPWVEIFIRHWYLQSQVLHRHNVTDMLSEAVDLLEFSSRDNNSDCPQSICVVQDLANTYAQKDGPAFIEERKAIALETLERIDPSWPCYDCIGDEYISALVDEKQLDEAMDRIAFMREEMIKSGKSEGKFSFFRSETFILIQQKKYQQAETIIKNATNIAGGESYNRYKSALTALTLAYQNKFEEAEDFVLDFREVLKAQSHYSYWCEYQYLAFKQGFITDFQELNYCFNTITDNFIKNGVQRDTLEILVWQIELALEENQLFTAQQSILKSLKIIKELSKDLGATEKFNALQQQYQQAKQAYAKTVDLSEENIATMLNEKQSLSLEFLSLAIQIFPDNHALQTANFDCLTKNGFITLALDYGLNTLKTDLSNTTLLNQYGHLLLNENQTQSYDDFFVEKKFSQSNQEIQCIYLWLTSRRHHTNNTAKALEYIEKLLDIHPQSETYLEKAANLYSKNENHQQAL
ncbi:MAG: hypothetical protein L3J83_08550, partial [Proteobacteria bacterium]|nr:hypothetical protein [Pseudomonadota bacterium]